MSLTITRQEGEVMLLGPVDAPIGVVLVSRCKPDRASLRMTFPKRILLTRGELVGAEAIAGAVRLISLAEQWGESCAAV